MEYIANIEGLALLAPGPLVVVGALVLFALMRLLLTALVPYKADERRSEMTPGRSRLLSAGQRWGIVLAGSTADRRFCFLSEMSEGGAALPVGRLMFVASVFIGLGS